MYVKFFKRFFDILFSILAMPVVLFVVFFSAIIIKIEDGGSIFYNAKRIGKNGKLFKMFKLRTMIENAPDIRLQDGSTYNSDDDPRVTKFGRFARKTSIDELPQILNVFIGNMSFIGPRPDPPDWLDKYPKEIKDFLNVKPGITGYNQAYFRNETDGNEKMMYDYYYYRNISFILDCKILFKTIITVLKRENTYKPSEKTECDAKYEIGSEFDYYSNIEFLDNKINNLKKKKNIYYFQSGRDSLKAIAKKYFKDRKTALLPALCCESMVEPFKKYNYEVRYYKLNEDYSINKDDLKAKLSQDALFVFINYFGNKAIANSDLKSIKKQNLNIIIIEDKTHDFLENSNEKLRDYVVVSIRKWFAIPDGGFVITNKKLGCSSCNKRFTKIRIKGLKLKSNYIRTANKEVKEDFLKLFKDANNELDLNEIPHKMSRISKKIYSKINFNKIKEIRKKNIDFLYKNLKNNKNIESILVDNSKCCLYFPILVKDRDIIQERLAKRGIYCPVIWPLPEDAKNICKISDKTSENMLAIPCDQRYRDEEMKYIVKVINEI